MVHVGDDQSFDFDTPKRLGIIAFYLDRTGEHLGESTIHSLGELSEKILGRARVHNNKPVQNPKEKKGDE